MTAIPDSLEVLIIGAGFAGICAGIKLDDQGIGDYHIVDKADGIGGTWWNNRYPGAACDVPSHFYCFSFEPNPNWSRLFSPQKEIQAYIENTARKYGLLDRITLSTGVEKLVYDEASGRWQVTLSTGQTVSARFVINGTGGLHKPSVPAFEGLQDFRGTAMHTAQWDENYDWTGKKIAIVGSAASAIQALPELAKTADHVTVFQRTPNYIGPRNDYAYSDKWKRRFARFPWLMKLYRTFMFLRLDLLIYPIIRRPKYRHRVAKRVHDYIREEVKDPALHQTLIPDYEMGCKRMLIADDFYASLNRDNVTLETDGIKRFTANGIETDAGENLDVDLVVFATGFDLAGHMTALDVRGEGGLALNDYWADGVHAYQGVMVPHFPNYFLITGPNTGVGTTSVVFMIEQSMGWILRAIAATPDGQQIAVREEADVAYNERIQAALDDTVWASGCKSWYIREDGRNETLYPWNARTFRRQMAQFTAADLIFSPVPAARPAHREAAE